MKLAIMQPYLFPYIGYFQLINAVDKFVAYDDVTFIKQGWINRNRILLNDQPYLFTIPVNNISSNTLICNTEISNRILWKPKLLKTIEQAYKKAPFFNEVFRLIEEIFFEEHIYISQLAVKSLKAIAHYLQLKTEIVETSTIFKNNYLNAQERLLDICMRETATQYINPIGGLELYSRDVFQQNEIQLNFIKSKSIEYKQYNDQFVPWLSIIDIMMFNSRDEISKMLNQYELV